MRAGCRHDERDHRHWGSPPLSASSYAASSYRGTVTITPLPSFVSGSAIAHALVRGGIGGSHRRSGHVTRHTQAHDDRDPYVVGRRYTLYSKCDGTQRLWSHIFHWAGSASRMRRSARLPPAGSLVFVPLLFAPRATARAVGDVAVAFCRTAIPILTCTARPCAPSNAAASLLLRSW